MHSRYVWMLTSELPLLSIMRDLYISKLNDLFKLNLNDKLEIFFNHAKRAILME